MTIDQFRNHGWTPGQSCDYGGTIYKIASVDFAEDLVGLENPLSDEGITWVRCENMDLEKQPIEHSGSSDCYPPVGTRVVVVDGSEAHGDEGVVWGFSNGVCLIELDAGCVWPIGEPWEVKVLCGRPSSATGGATRKR